MPHLYRTILDLNTGEVAHEPVLPKRGPNDTIIGYDFPTMRMSLLGRRSRYGYFAEFDDSAGLVAVVKIDTEVRAIEMICMACSTVEPRVVTYFGLLYCVW